MPDFWKAVAGAVGSIVGACIAFAGVWLTQRLTAKREERQSDQEKEAVLRAQALQFITDVVSAAQVMSTLTYYAGASVKSKSKFTMRIKEYEKEIALLLVKIQAGQIALSFMTDKLEDASLRSWESVRDQADEIDDVLTKKGEEEQVQAIAEINVDVSGIVDPLRKDFSEFLRPNTMRSTVVHKF